MTGGRRLLVRDLAQLVSPAGTGAPLRGRELAELDRLDDAFLLVESGRIAAIGRMSDLPSLDGDVEELDGRGLCAVPGLVDCHTHPAFGGDRVEEFALRAAGASYEELHAAGGGILSTVRATRAAGEDGLTRAVARHRDWMLRHGTTAWEGKSGYGLDRETELASLRAIRAAGGAPTWLGAHAVPPEFGDAEGYLDFALAEVLPEAARIAEAADVFLERGAFDAAQARRYLEACRDAGLTLRLHGDQFTGVVPVRVMPGQDVELTVPLHPSRPLTGSVAVEGEAKGPFQVRLLANELKQAIEARWDAYEQRLQAASRPPGAIDVTLPGAPPRAPPTETEQPPHQDAHGLGGRIQRREGPLVSAQRVGHRLVGRERVRVAAQVVFDLGEQACIVVTRHRTRIGGVTVILQRSLDHPWQLVGGNAEGSKALRNLQSVVERFDLRGEVGACREIHRGVEALHLVADVTRIEAQDRRKQDRVERAVMKTRLSESSERVTERVHAAEPFLKRQPAFERAHHHVRPGRHVASIRTRRVDVPPDAARSIQRDRFGRRVEARREKRFNAMRQRIQACRRGQGRRKANGELRIAHRASRNEMRADEPELTAVVERDERRAAYFGARSCRRRYRDDRGNGADSGDASVDRGVGFERFRMAGQQRNTFGEIDRRPYNGDILRCLDASAAQLGASAKLAPTVKRRYDALLKALPAGASSEPTYTPSAKYSAPAIRRTPIAKTERYTRSSVSL